MILPVLFAALATGQKYCPPNVKGVVCFHEAHFHCPPNMTPTAHGCWNGHRLLVYRYTTKRTTSAVVGVRRRS